MEQQTVWLLGSQWLKMHATLLKQALPAKIWIHHLNFNALSRRSKTRCKRLTSRQTKSVKALVQEVSGPWTHLHCFKKLRVSSMKDRSDWIHQQVTTWSVRSWSKTTTLATLTSIIKWCAREKRLEEPCASTTEDHRCSVDKVKLKFITSKAKGLQLVTATQELSFRTNWLCLEVIAITCHSTTAMSSTWVTSYKAWALKSDIDP